MNATVHFSFMGMQCSLAGDNEQILKSSLDCVLHFAEHIRREYPTADLAHVMLLTSMRMGELLCSVQKKEKDGDDTLKNRLHDYEAFVERVIDLLAIKV